MAVRNFSRSAWYWAELAPVPASGGDKHRFVFAQDAGSDPAASYAC